MAGPSHTLSRMSLFGLAGAPKRMAGTELLFGESIKRRVFFSFHFDDVMRVNVVRNAWKIEHPDGPMMRSFYDSSLWENRQLERPESVKNVIRQGVSYTSAVCVLVGTETWSREWVRYEMARAIIDERGLLAVHLNSIRHHRTLMTNPFGYNPLRFVGVGKVQENVWIPARYYLFEFVPVLTVIGYQWLWSPYTNYTQPVNLPRWLPEPLAGYVMPLSAGTFEYDFIAQNGHKNIGAWIDLAARRAGR